MVPGGRSSQQTVDVIQEDIDRAISKNSSRCIVATAIARTFPKAQRVSVDVHSIRFTNGENRYTYLTPPKVSDYIVAFDAGDTIHPFSFRLRDDQRLVQRRKRRTLAGQEINNVRRVAADKAAKVEQLEADPNVPTLRLEVARLERTEAEAHKALVEAKHADAKHTEVEQLPGVPKTEILPSRRTGRTGVFRRNVREYGRRAMRVNQPDDQPGDYRGPLDTPE